MRKLIEKFKSFFGEPRNKDAILWIASLLLLAVFVGVQIRGERVADIDVKATAKSMIKIMNEKVQKEDQLVFKKRYGLNPEEYKEIIYYGPVSNMNAEEFLLVEMKDQSQSEALQSAIENRISTQKNNFDGYGTDQLALIKKAKVVVKGKYAFFIISKNSDKAYDTYTRILRTGGKK